MEIIKGCPLCGSKPDVVQDKHGTLIFCRANDGQEGGGHGTRVAALTLNEAISLWNSRPYEKVKIVNLNNLAKQWQFN